MLFFCALLLTASVANLEQQGSNSFAGAQFFTAVAALQLEVEALRAEVKQARAASDECTLRLRLVQEELRRPQVK